MERLDLYLGLLRAESERQNLVSRTTLADAWQRHILDSLQLDDLAGPGSWADIGSGAGLPGLVIAIAGDRAMALIEPRKRRAEFLLYAVEALGLADRVQVLPQRAESARIAPPAIVSARAVGALDQIFTMAAHFSDRATLWILPKGRSAADEVAVARRTWQGDFHLVASLTEPDSAIVVARDVRRRGPS